jgi:methanol:N,N-dimethyl-4-nitrosoaniline oxidoreductase
MGKGKYAQWTNNGGHIAGDDRDVDRITRHVQGDGSTPGNAREVTYEAVHPVVRHSLTGSYYH